MRIRWLIRVAGQVEGLPDGVHVGDETDVSDEQGAIYVANHYAVPVVEERAEKAVKQAPAEEKRAFSETHGNPRLRGPAS